MAKQGMNSGSKESTTKYEKHPERKNHLAPKPEAGYPIKPLTVASDPVASSRWDDVCHVLNELKVLTTADVFLLEVHCVDYAIFLKILAMIRKHGISIVGPKGTEIAAPEATHYHHFAKRIQQQINDFGLTPARRHKLHVVGTDEDDPLDEWLNNS